MDFDYYVIQPDFSWWNTNKCHEGRKLADGFKYSSDINTEWLSIDELRTLISDC